jgi:hypothetical protein
MQVGIEVLVAVYQLLVDSVTQESITTSADVYVQEQQMCSFPLHHKLSVSLDAVTEKAVQLPCESCKAHRVWEELMTKVRVPSSGILPVFISESTT